MEHYNEDGLKFLKEFDSFFEPLLKKWVEEGYSVRDMMSIIQNSLPLTGTGTAMREYIRQAQEEVE